MTDLLPPAMVYDARFSSAAQPVAARAWVLQQMQTLLPALRRNTPAAHRLRARYVAGELSWTEMRQALGAEAG